MEFTVSVIYGSVRSAREGIKAARFIKSQCQKRGWNTHLIDPAETQLPLIDLMYKEYQDDNAPPEMRKLSQILSESDGILVVSGEYNHAAPPALLNLMDHFQSEYFWKPSGIVCYSAGPFAGVRAAMHLRSYLCELGCPSISSMLPISRVQDAFDNGGNPLEKSYNRRAAKFLDEFQWYMSAYKSQRNHGTPY